MDDLLIKLYEISRGKIKDDHFRPVFDLWQVGGKIDVNCCIETKKNCK